MSHVERTLKLIREQGGFPWMVERYIHQRKLKIDFLHIIDLLALSRSAWVGPKSTELQIDTGGYARVHRSTAPHRYGMIFIHGQLEHSRF